MRPGRALATLRGIAPSPRPTGCRYAKDVVEQLILNVLMGYDGAPAFDDLEQLTITSVAEGFRRTLDAARRFLLALHDQPRFKETELRPYWDSHRILRDGVSERSPTAESFGTNAIFSLYRLDGWPKSHAVLAGIYLGEKESAQITVALGDVTEDGDRVADRWAHSGDPEPGEDLGALANVEPANFPYLVTYNPGAVWAYDSAWARREGPRLDAWQA